MVTAPAPAGRPTAALGRWVRRAAEAVATLLLSSVVIFAVIHSVPGDPATALAGPDAPQATVTALRHQLHLDQPLPVQYGHWLAGVLTGDLGRSYLLGADVGQLVAAGLGNTAVLGLSALALAVLVALALSITGALWPNGWYAAAVNAFQVLTIAVPTFVTGVVLVEVFAVAWPVLPAGGAPPSGYFGRPDLTAQYLLMPTICLAAPVASALSRFLSESLRAELARPYVLAARAAGIPRRRIVLRGALRNAVAPVVTVLGIQTGQLLSSAVLVEAIFAWPGLGQLLVEAIAARDYPTVQAVLLLTVAVFVVTRVAADVLADALDPTGRG
jgi:peptide/nickel transport system permease protein